MHDDRAIVEARIKRTVNDRIKPAIYGPHHGLTVTVHHVDGEPISIDDARAATYEPFEVGGRWGRPWGTTWFQLNGEVPDDWAGKAVDVVLDIGYVGMVGFGPEALVWGSEGPRQGLHPDHRSVRIADQAEPGQPVSLLIEAAANPNLQMSFSPTALGDPTTLPDNPICRLNHAALAIRNDGVHDLYLDIRILVGLMRQLPTNEPRRNEILRALERGIDRLDLHNVVATAEEARDELADVLARPAHASAHKISAIGHAHIDTAWMWPLRETIRKCARTFSTAVGLMDDHPEYKFACSQAVQYQWMKDHYPSLYARIKEKVASGQFVPVGGMWVEADCNIPSGESLVRQFIHGKRFFSEEFSVEPKEVWIPDVFGYAANLPQIMRKAGCDYFLTQKLSWNKTNRFPHHSFNWEGLDGTQIFTHFPPAETYNGVMKPVELVRAAQNFADHGYATRSLYPFGHGDGGGGPTRDMLEMAKRVKNLEGCPTVEIEAPSDFFAKAAAEYTNPPVWRGELYLEMHRGTYTTQAATKWGNRRGELLLREAELWSTAATVANGRPYPADPLDASWKTLLLHQFHDIIPGSSIAWVHQETERDHAALHESADDLVASATHSLTAPDQTAPTVTLWNAASHERCETAIINAETAGHLPDDDLAAIDGDGGRHSVQRLSDGRLVFHAAVPGLGTTSVRFARGNAPVGLVRADDNYIQVGERRVTWNHEGLLTSIGHGLLDPRRPGNLFQVHPDHPNEYDAWDLDRFYTHAVTDLTEIDEITVLDAGPLIARVKFVRTFGNSRIEQVMQVTESGRIDFITDVDWQENEKVLKVAFPTTLRADNADYEVQFGTVQRPTHSNTSWDYARFEVCAQKWAALREHDRGLAVLNDCKYGHDVHGQVMRLTLLRSPKFPDPNADIGRHHFTYSLLPFDGDLRTVVNEGYALNLPLRSTGGSAPTTPVVRVTDGLIVEAVKQAEDRSGDVVVRIFEPVGRHVTGSITTGFDFNGAVETDLLERDTRQLEAEGRTVSLSLGPYEVITIRLRPSSR